MERRVEITVTPKSRRRELVVKPDGGIRAYVPEPPEAGKATEAARELLAEHLGVPKTKLRLVRGAKSRKKVFEVLP